MRSAHTSQGPSPICCSGMAITRCVYMCVFVWMCVKVGFCLTRTGGCVSSGQLLDAIFQPSCDSPPHSWVLIPTDALGCRALHSSMPCLRQQWRHSWADCSTCAAPSMWRPTSKLRHGTKAAHSSRPYALDVTLCPLSLLFQVYVLYYLPAKVVLYHLTRSIILICCRPYPQGRCSATQAIDGLQHPE